LDAERRGVMGRKGGKSLTLIAASVIFLSFVTNLSIVVYGVETKIHNLDTALDYTTIQSAIDAPETLNGHTILVDAGIYYENVIVTKSISLIGENKFTTTIDGSGAGTVVLIDRVSNVTISQFTIQNSGVDSIGGIYVPYMKGGVENITITDNRILQNYNGILAYGFHNGIIKDNQIVSSNREGIMLSTCENVTVLGNDISLSGDYGIWLSATNQSFVLENKVTQSHGDGILVIRSSNTVLSRNQISEGSDDTRTSGVRISNSENIIVSNNSLFGNAKGIHLHAGTSNTFLLDNRVESSIAEGVLIENCANNILQRNNIATNEQGIVVSASSDISISGNIMTNNYYNSVYLGLTFDSSISGNAIMNSTWLGIELGSDSSGNRISANTITNTEYAIGLTEASGNFFWHNNFVNNTENVWAIIGYANTWDDGYPSGGNYWSNYNGIDADGDGVGDTPYIIDSDNIDNYPLMSPWTPELLLDGLTTWYWLDNTTINSVIEGDVDSDGLAEVMTAGYYFDGERECAQLVVWDGTTLGVHRVTSWYWTENTRINSIAVGNLDDDGALELVTGGYYFDGSRKVAQLVVWDGAKLNVEGLTTWYWTGDTEINSLSIEDVDGDGVAEIITGGYYNDGVRDVAQLVIWNGETLEMENLATWYWTNDTKINSVAVENLNDDEALEIITGGYYTDGRKIAQLVVWDGILLSPENIATWYWTSDTEIASVEAADVDGDCEIEIATGGYYNDDARDVAQLVIWSSDLQTVENLAVWYWESDTRIGSICINDVDSDGSIEIVTGGFYNDLSRDVAQLVVWDGSTLAVDYFTTWYWTSDTCICSVAVGNFDSDAPSEVITGGYSSDSNRNWAQITIWEIS
jgi:parallel beta-helix repeat protein